MLCSPFLLKLKIRNGNRGVIAIVASEEEARDLSFRKKNLLDKVPADIVGRLADRMPVLLFPFDFTTMVPVAGTQHRLLR